jgi:flagellar biosynthesis/type III secretory pathway protein FliH
LSEYLTKRAGYWHFQRRVPEDFSNLDKRGIVRHSTKVAVVTDKRGNKAAKIAEAMNRDLEAYWRRLYEGRAQEAAERYADAKRRARVPGLDYVETARSTIEVLERLEKLEKLVSTELAECRRLLALG